MSKWGWKVVDRDPFVITLLVDDKTVARTKVFMDKGRWTCIIFNLFYKFISYDNPEEVIDYVNEKLKIDASYDIDLCLSKIRENMKEKISVEARETDSRLLELRNDLLLEGKLIDQDSKKESMVLAGRIDEFRNEILSSFINED